MTKIEAKGKIYGIETVITCEVNDSGHLTARFNGKNNPVLWSELVANLRRRFVIAGTYIPTNAYSTLNIYNVLEYHTFDAKPEIKVLQGEIETLPYEEGVVY